MGQIIIKDQKTMKKIITGFCVLLLTGAFFACGGADKAEQAKAEKEAVTIDSLSTQVESSMNDVDSKREDMDAALEDLLKEFETEK